MKLIRKLNSMQIRAVFVSGMGVYMYLDIESLKANGLKTFMLKHWEWRFLYVNDKDAVYELNGINVNSEAEAINYIGWWLHQTGFDWSVSSSEQDGTVFMLHHYKAAKRF